MSSRLVYSSGLGRICPDCQRPVSQCICKRQQKRPKGDGVVRVGRETKGRKGKGVTVISGLTLSGDSLMEFARHLKQKCGSGGSVKSGVIEIQGDHREALVDYLKESGYTVKFSGG